MGRAEYHASDHKPTTLQAEVEAMRFHAFTCLIMSNPKVFQPTHDFNNLTLLNIFETSLDVYKRVAEANAIKATDATLASERLAQQEYALAAMEWLLRLQNLARAMFPGLRNKPKKFYNWVRMAASLKDRIKAWHESDKKRLAAVATSAQDDFAEPKGKAENGSKLISSLGGQQPLAVSQSGQLE